MRLDEKRQEELEPQRIDFAKSKIEGLGHEVTHQDNRKIQFLFKDKTVTFYPYSGWASGASIKDGRGIHKLLKQLV